MPRKPDKPLTAEEQFKLQELQEQELTCLQRQYALLEKDRHLYTSGCKLTRINKILSIYKKEYLNIEADLEVANAPLKKLQDNKASNLLTTLLEDYDFYQDQIKTQRQYLKEMDDGIKGVEKDVVRLRSMQITDRQHEERVWHAIKILEKLMNQLDVQNKKFGTICAKNADMKVEIKKRLSERESFMKAWDKLIKKLTIGKKFMLDLIEQATIAYDQREEWCSKLHALRMKAHNDFVSHTQQMRELKRKQDNNRKLEDFCNIRGQRRVMRDLQQKQRLKAIETQHKLKDRLKEYNQHISDILSFTKETQIDEIAKLYYRKEAENFSLFQQVNNLIHEMEYLSDELQNLQDEITAEQELEALREEKRQTTLNNLETELDEANKILNENTTELNDVEQNINGMLSGIQSLVKICRCNTDPILQLLGDNTRINIYNYKFFVKLIEQQVNKAFLEVYQQEKFAAEKRKGPTGQKVIWDEPAKGQITAVEKYAPANPCPLCVQRELVMDVVDHLQHVMNKEQVKIALKERLENPEQADVRHNVSKCFLPESREVVQKRYQ